MSFIFKNIVFFLLHNAIMRDVTHAEVNEVEKAFNINELVPDVVPRAPKCLLTIIYPSGAKVHLGNEVTPTQAKDVPYVLWEANPGSFYTLAMIDPDVPSRKNPTSGSFQHWLVGNIPGNNVESGDFIAEYISPAPPLGTDFHRYVFLLYEQPYKVVFHEEYLNSSSNIGRTPFSMTTFGEKYNFDDPTAGNMFIAEYDDYVPIVTQEISG